MKALAFGIGFGMSVQAWRNWPSDGPVSSYSAMVLCLVGMVAAYFGGKHRRGSNSAVAVASAEATAVASNQVNLAVVIPGSGATGYQNLSRVPDDSLEWFGQARAAVEADDLDGMDLAEFVTAESEAME